MDGSYDMNNTQQRTWLEYLKENWMIILVVVLAIAGLIYWYYCKGNTDSGSGSSYTEPMNKFTIHRMRGGMH
jgi:hypothetical protein